jgi:malate dehydrogenase (oxaloacetate-decarboxylating)(NADP+)
MAKHDLTFGREYIIPKALRSQRLIAEIPPAVAKAAMDSGVAKEPIDDWDRYKNNLLDRLGSDNKLVRLLLNRAKTNPKRVVFAEADQLNVLKAAQIAYDEGVAIPILLGRQDVIRDLMNEIDFDADIQIVDPKADEQTERKNRYADAYWQKAPT